MTITIDAILCEVREKHLAAPGATEAALRNLEAECGYSLPNDLRAFYLATNGAQLFVGEYGWAHRVLPIEEVCLARKLIWPDDFDAPSPAGWFAICDEQDGNYVAADLAQVEGTRCPMIDCYHETFAEPEYYRVVAESFTEFMGKMLAAGGLSYYLQ